MASTSCPTIVSSDLNPSATRWDVFLSFRGSDTRHNFTSHLYAALDRHGLRTFKDDPQLRSGEVISDALLQAIQDSRSCVVVLSENYASSPWCLDELVQIYKCHKLFSRSVIPVFYNIDPSVVRHQLGSFKEAFGKHEIRFLGEMEKVNKWRLTLNRVADLSGKHVTQNRSEADIISQIVDEILLEIDLKTLDVAKYPVGLESRVKDITALLSSGAEGVLKFGIYGMGGVGKTTLAKALYNQLLLGGGFKGSCFLANCREVSGTAKGLVCLQQQLINDVLQSKNVVNVDNIDSGVKLIRARICSTKVLVVIDDLDHHQQFEYLQGPFASGSVVIITTRDEEVLNKIEVETRYQYRLNELDYKESLALLTQHAFRNANPSNTLMDLCKEILHHAAGLPLALEVFGSYLYKQTEVGWKSFSEKLQRIPDSSIQKRLIVSLDALELEDPMLKKMFLDIACFFVGKKKQEAIEVLETYYSYADYRIDILKKRCLLTINTRNQLRMHDLLRDMGRDVAGNNFLYEPEKRSRLWLPEDICEVLMKRKGTEAVEVILPSYPINAQVPVATETFKMMSKLRFLRLPCAASITGSFEQTFKDLRWLKWENCPLTSFPSECYPQRLVFLALPGSKLRNLQGLKMVLVNLKDLDMSRSLDLTTSPDFTKLPCLKTLNLKDCKSLEEIHISIGILEKLVCLKLSGCVKLKSIPDTVCNLRALEFLDIDNCKSLEVLPAELGNIKSLKGLTANNLTISKLPNTICNLRALEVLDIDGCRSLEALPAELGNIKSLKRLLMKGLAVPEIPNSIGHLHELVYLQLGNNKNLRILPDSFVSLKSLEVLEIWECEKLETLPDKFWNLTRLRELYSAGTPLKKIPDMESSQIASLSNLEQLISPGNALTVLPYSIGQLLNLTTLRIGESVNLFSIEELPPNLINLSAFRCKSLERLPNLSNLKRLETLDLTNCKSLRKIQGLMELASLKHLYLKGCSSSLVESTLTERVFQVWSGYGHQIHIYPSEFPEWVSQSSHEEDPTISTLSFDLMQDVSLSHNYLGLILCLDGKLCNVPYQMSSSYSVKNTASNFIWSSLFVGDIYMVLLPRSIFPIKNGDDRIEVTSEAKICAMHLLYKQKLQYKRRKKLPLSGTQHQRPSTRGIVHFFDWHFQNLASKAD